MCRSALEYPPNGKRCGKGDHLSPEDKEAWRLARNAREKELYYIRKERNRRAVNAEKAAANNEQAFKLPSQIKFEPEVNVTPDPISDLVDEPEKMETEMPFITPEVAQSRLQQASQDPKRLAGGNDDNLSMSNPEERARLANILASQQPDLAYMPVVKEDNVFADDNESANEVHRVTLSDGTVGYFKPYEHAPYHSLDTCSDYGHTMLGTSLNEVAAYKLTQALGKDYEGLVPETVIREYNGQIGTLQCEAKGTTGEYNLLRLRNEGDRVDKAAFRRAALFDMVAGSQDRHAWNYLVDDSQTKLKPTLIDNGYAFPDIKHHYVNATVVVSYVSREGKTKLTKKEKTMLQKLLDDPTLGGVTDYISEDSARQMRHRITRLIDNGFPSVW